MKNELHDPTQIPLDFTVRGRAAVSPTDVDALLRRLRGNGWLSARDLVAGNPAWTDRRLRTLAHASRGHIISGQQGYRLTCEATAEERHHAAAWLEHQAKEMATRAGAIRRVSHRAEIPPAFLAS